MFATVVALCFLTADPVAIFAPDNLVAWCIVPFDAKKRGPEDRVEMLAKIGFRKFAYDWRAEHLPTFDRELTELKRRKIELTAVWFPAKLDADAQFLLTILKKHQLRTQLWVMLPDPAPGLAHDAKLRAAVTQLTPIAVAAGDIGCRVSLYNHGGWGGEPSHMVEVVRAMKRDNVGIVYNLHHGHEQLPRFAEHLKLMLPMLDCLNLNGMDTDGEKRGRKIRVLGTGERDLELLKAIIASGYTGPIGILGHTNDDAEARLRDNLTGLKCLTHQLTGKRLDTKPIYLTQLSIKLEKTGAIRWENAFLQSKNPTLEIVIESTKAVYPGTTKRDHDDLLFEPRFPLTPGVAYIVKSSAGQEPLLIPMLTKPAPASVVKIEPGMAILPENLLRMYIHFDRAMTPGDAYEHIRLLDAKGLKVADPFLELEQELWSADGKRFTLLFDPGRVKRGLKPREELGPALAEGQDFTLVVDAKWQDENGQALKSETKKTFRVGPPQDQPLDTKNWKISTATNGPITVQFDRPLDAALAARMILLATADGKETNTTMTLSKDAKTATWGDAKTRWPGTDYKLIIDTRLEDPCGNRIGRAFEVDELRPVEKSIVPKFIEIPFTLQK
jgi:sugar phosphate isomerase/epimerase